MIPDIDSSKCTRCWQCVKVCPYNAILKVQNSSCSKCIKYCTSYEVSCNNINCVIDYDMCNACGMCIDACVDHAIGWVENTENIDFGRKLVGGKK